MSHHRDILGWLEVQILLGPIYLGLKFCTFFEHSYASSSEEKFDAAKNNLKKHWISKKFLKIEKFYAYSHQQNFGEKNVLH
jgi:hypothetical protein